MTVPRWVPAALAASRKCQSLSQSLTFLDPPCLFQAKLALFPRHRQPALPCVPTPSGVILLRPALLVQAGLGHDPISPLCVLMGAAEDAGLPDTQEVGGAAMWSCPWVCPVVPAGDLCLFPPTVLVEPDVQQVPKAETYADTATWAGCQPTFAFLR